MSLFMASTKAKRAWLVLKDNVSSFKNDIAYTNTSLDVTYLWSTSKESIAVKKAADLLLRKKSDNETSEKYAECLFNTFYEQRVRSTKEEGWKLPKSIIPCSDPDASLNFQSASEEAVEIFRQCEPEAEFMPAAEQDPDEEY